jgi:hypothetical protein
LRDTAAQLTTTINHLKDNQSKIRLQPYRDYVASTYERAHRTAQMIRDFVEYDKATSKAEALEQKLELSETEKVTKSNGLCTQIFRHDAYAPEYSLPAASERQVSQNGRIT